MPKLIALLSALFLLGTLTGSNAWAADPETSVIDRHAVWTKIIKDNKKMIAQSQDRASGETSNGGQAKMEDKQNQSSGSGDKASSESVSEDHAKMNVRIQDLPWQRVG